MRARLRALRDGNGAEDGFSLVELLIAMMIITGVLVVLIAVQTSALVTTVHAKQRQQGTAVANEVMEELRALPWATILRGNDDAYSSAGPDPFAPGGVLKPAFDSAIDEGMIITSMDIANAPTGAQVPAAPPLYDLSGSNVTLVTDPAIPDTVFTARSYVSRESSMPTGVVNLTVIVTWTPRNTDVERHVLVRSSAYAPSGGCGEAAETPFLGACQAMLDADAGARSPTLTLAGFELDLSAAPGSPEAAPQASTVLPGSDVVMAQMSTSESAATMTSFQASIAGSRVTAAGSALTTDTGNAEQGRGQAVNSASSDVGAAGAAPPNPADVPANTGTTGSRLISGTEHSILLNPPSSLSGAARAKAGGSCRTGVPVDQPCSQGTVGSEAGMSASLTIPGATFPLITTTGASTRDAWTARFPTAASTSAAVGCTTIADAGCVSAGASRALASMTMASGGWSLPAGGSGPTQLVQLTGYADSVRTEHGVGKIAVPPAFSRSGSLQVWNGTTMATVNLSPAGSGTSVTIPQVVKTVGGRTVFAEGKVEVRPSATTRTGSDPACSTAPCGVTIEQPSVTVSLTYTIVQGTDAHVVVVGFDLGAIRASAKYQAAPDA